MATKIWTSSDTKALYAVAGMGDLAVEKLRTVPAKLAELRANRDPAQTLQGQAQEFVTGLPAQAGGLYSSIMTKATEVYGDLATRGEDVVGRIRRQRASQDLAAQAQMTVRRAKATVASARSTVGSARSTGVESAKAVERGADTVG